MKKFDVIASCSKVQKLQKPIKVAKTLNASCSTSGDYK